MTAPAPCYRPPVGVFNDTHQDTTPGSGCLMAPPVGFAGEYQEFLKSLFVDLGARQRLLVLARRQTIGDGFRWPRPTFEGPYAAEARAGLAKIFRWTKEPPAAPKPPPLRPRTRPQAKAVAENQGRQRRSKYGPVAQI